MIKFFTLGPAGSNHQFVTERYLDFQGIAKDASIDFFRTFEEGAQKVLSREADFMIQCAVHPATMATVAKYLVGLYVVDTFISGSQDLAIVKRKDVAHPSTLAAMRPTMDYTDIGKWKEVIDEPTVMGVAAGMLDGRYEAGLTYVSVVQQHPDRFEIQEFIGTVDDAWIVYGRERISDGTLVGWKQSPAARRYRQMIDGTDGSDQAG